MLDENSNVEKTSTDMIVKVRSSSEHLLGEKRKGRRKGSVVVKMAEGMTLFLETSQWTCCVEFHLCVKNWRHYHAPAAALGLDYYAAADF